MLMAATDDPLVSLSTRVPASLRDRIDAFGFTERRDRSNMALVMLEEAADARDNPPKKGPTYPAGARRRKAEPPPGWALPDRPFSAAEMAEVEAPAERKPGTRGFAVGSTALGQQV